MIRKSLTLAAIEKRSLRQQLYRTPSYSRYCCKAGFEHRVRSANSASAFAISCKCATAVPASTPRRRTKTNLNSTPEKIAPVIHGADHRGRQLLRPDLRQYRRFGADSATA